MSVGYVSCLRNLHMCLLTQITILSRVAAQGRLEERCGALAGRMTEDKVRLASGGKGVFVKCYCVFFMPRE